MSIESAKAFIERIKTDEAFAKKVTDCKETEARIALVKSVGFDFTMEEVKKVTSELSEEELEAVAGGGNTGHCYEGAPGGKCYLFWGMNTAK